MNQILGILLLVIIFTLFLIILTSKGIKGTFKTGLIFLMMGILFWLANLDLLPYIKWERDWPWILIILGLWMIFSSARQKRSRRDIIKILEELRNGKISLDEALKKIRKE
ncbi:MAG: hypothetical protein ABIM42_04210 [candidate division WOR-3 bacterium]